jgi:hypothetical protein
MGEHIACMEEARNVLSMKLNKPERPIHEAKQIYLLVTRQIIISR